MWRNIKWKKSPIKLKNKTKTVENQLWICPEMFALVFASHQKTRVLRGSPRKQKFNGKKDGVLCSIYGL